MYGFYSSIPYIRSVYTQVFDGDRHQQWCNSKGEEMTLDIKQEDIEKAMTALKKKGWG